MPDWDTILLPGTPLPELVLRGTVTFLALMTLLRVVGQREAGSLGLTDLLVVVLIAQAAGPGMLGGADTIADGIVVIVTMLTWSVALDALSYRWPTFARLVKARARLLISDGHLDRRVMRREFMTHEEVISQLRLHGISDISAVHRAYLEPNGMISVIPGSGEPTIGPPPPPR